MTTTRRTNAEEETPVLKHGIVIHDRRTWPNLPDKAQWLADFGTGEVVQFTYDQWRILKEEVHALLHTEEIAVTCEAARRVLSGVEVGIAVVR